MNLIQLRRLEEINNNLQSKIQVLESKNYAETDNRLKKMKADMQNQIESVLGINYQLKEKLKERE